MVCHLLVEAESPWRQVHGSIQDHVVAFVHCLPLCSFHSHVCLLCTLSDAVLELLQLRIKVETVPQTDGEYGSNESDAIPNKLGE